MITKEKVISLIKLNDAPVWGLKLKNGSTAYNVAYFDGQALAKDLPRLKIVEKSIDHLEHVLSEYEDDDTFLIEMKSSKNANGSSVFGPFEFRKVVRKNEVSQVQGLSGIPQANFDEYLQRERDLMRREHELDKEKLLLQLKGEMQNSQTQTVINGIAGIVKEAAPILGAFLSKTPTQLSGVQAEEELSDVEVLDPMDNAWKEFYEKWRPSTQKPEDVKALDNLLTKTVNEFRQNQKQAATATTSGS